VMVRRRRQSRRRMSRGRWRGPHSKEKYSGMRCPVWATWTISMISTMTMKTVLTTVSAIALVWVVGRPMAAGMKVHLDRRGPVPATWRSTQRSRSRI